MGIDRSAMVGIAVAVHGEGEGEGSRRREETLVRVCGLGNFGPASIARLS